MKGKIRLPKPSSVAFSFRRKPDLILVAFGFRPGLHMPARAEIAKQITELKAQSQDNVRRDYLRQLAEHTHRDTIVYASAWTSAKRHAKIPPNLFSLSTDDIQGFMAALHGLNKKNLDLIIHSPGGSLEAADQLVQYLRSKYDHIRAIIPHNAMSASTMLACACDEIIMGRQSALGPIDPQFSWATPSGGTSAAAQSILEELELARADIARDPALATIWAPRLKDYPAGIFAACSTVMALAQQKVAEWLAKYMFKAESDPATLASTVSAWLASASIHKTHGRPLGFEICQQNGLKVTLLEDDQALQDLVLSVFHATAVTFDVTHCVKVIEGNHGKGHYMVVETK